MSAPFRKTTLGRELFEPDTTITNEKLIPFISLQTKWKGATLREIEYIINTGELVCFNRVKTIFENGEKNHYLHQLINHIYYESFTDEIIWDKNAVVFQSDIERIEKERPDFLCQIVFDNIEDDENSDMVPSSTENTYYHSIHEQSGVQKDLQTRISELEAALANSEAENAKLKERVAELENTALQGREAGKSADGEEFPAEYEDHGIFTMVAKLVDARAPVAEIMAALDDEQEFLSQRENGYFFHPNPAGKAPSTLRNYTKNTLKKAGGQG